MSSFEALYHGAPPWDIGRPQQEVVRLEEGRRIQGSVLDVGCGTGENSIYLGSRGHMVVGIDSAPTAIARARAKATGRRIDVLFHTADALDLDPGLGTFRSFLDCGLFHTFEDAQRPTYAASLARLAPPGARLFVICFSDAEPPGWGPRRIRKEELAPAFTPGWKLHEVHPAQFDTTIRPKPVPAWSAEFHRT